MVAVMALTERDCYTAAKGGVHALTRSMAPEYAPDRIRVNAIAPGLTLSDRVRGLIDQRAELRKLADQFLLGDRSEEHTSELQSLMRISYAVFCLKKKTKYT